MRRPPMTFSEYIAEKIDTSNSEACWPWPGAILENGYGRVGVRQYKRTPLAHRAVYEHLTGSLVPKGMHLDHTCHDPDLCKDVYGCLHRRCVNPSHLKVVTPKQHADRRVGQFCGRNHEFTPENIYWQTSARTGAKVRSCRKCTRQTRQRWRARRGLAQAS